MGTRARRKDNTLYAADLFCGAGGFSSGLLLAAKELGLDVDLIAVNHWDVAIATHSANHPDATHLCTGVDSVDPRKVVPGGRLHLLMASPECTHHSNARGGKPMSDQSRATAWHILRWCEALYVENVLIENVREFTDWGPLGALGRPLKSKKGQLFQQFLRSFRALGYTVEHRILNAAHYGDATTRQRLFIMATRKGRIAWPKPEYGPAKEAKALAHIKPWKTAREIIDWEIAGTSIYNRKRPLSPNTLARIMAGLRKYSGLPFVLGQQSGSHPRGVDQPIPTIAAAGAISLVEPFLVILRNHCDAKSVDGPVPTLAASGNHVGLAEPALQPLSPFLVPHFGERDGQEPRTHSVDAPCPTVTGHGAGSLVEPRLAFILPNEGFYRGNQPRSVDEPIPTVTQNGAGGLVEADLQPFVVATGHKGGNGTYTYGPDQPLPTVTTQNELGVVEPEFQPFIMAMEHSTEESGHGRRCYDVGEPLKTVTSKGQFGLVEPIIIGAGGNRGNGKPRSVNEPLKTVLAESHLGLVEPELKPCVINMKGQSVGRDVDAPVPSITAHAPHLYLAEPFLVNAGGPEVNPRSVEEPLNTVLTRDHMGLVQPYLVKYHGNHKGKTDGDRRTHDLNQPLPTLDTSNRFAIVEPCIIKFNGTGGPRSVDEPLDTVTTKDRFGLVEGAVAEVTDATDAAEETERIGYMIPDLQPGDQLAWLDIRFRMLQPHELAAAMSFPSTYHFAGNREKKVKQIGNAVPVQMGRALCQAILGAAQ